MHQLQAYTTLQGAKYRIVYPLGLYGLAKCVSRWWKIILVMVVTLSFIVDANAQGIKIGRLNYTLNSKSKTATVLGGNKESLSAGILDIPTVIEYDGVVYDVTKIEDHAFSGWKEIEWVNIPSGIENIGDGAFQNCRELWFVDIKGISITSIGAWAFAGCVKLQAFAIPPLVQKMGGHVFDGCTDLVTISFPGNFLREVPVGSCRGCKSLGTVNISIGIEKIGDEAFKDCCMGILILPSSLRSIGWYAFQNCKELRKILSFIYNPFIFEENVFSDYDNVVLSVPKGTYNRYKEVRYWNKFMNLIEEDLDEESTDIYTPPSVETKEPVVYSMGGKKVNASYSGLQIIRMPNGTIKKILIK